MNKKIIIIGFIILVVSIIVRLLYISVKNIKVDEFNPAMVIFVVDSSASNQAKLPEQKRFLKQICTTLDPEDQIKIIKVSQDAYLIYEGAPHNTNGIMKATDAFTKYEKEEYGTAYGDAFKKAFSYTLMAKKNGYTPAIVVIGDLENEGDVSKQVDWNLLSKNVAEMYKFVPNLSMMFLYAHPQKLDMVKEKLSPVLGETHLIISPEQNVDKSLRKFTKALGR